LKELVTNVVTVSPTRLSITVTAPSIVETARRLKMSGFDHVKAVTGVDHPEENRIDMVYHVSSYENLELAKILLEIRTSLNRGDPRINSLVEVWPSAEYLERETSDLMGVIFEGQPSKGRLFLLDSFEGGPPLRKDFKIRTEGIDA
jgi:NADH-quinone oxidoreductase subunit C